MSRNSKLKGIALAITATICFSNVYLFSKMAMNDIDLASFGVLWFGLAFLYNFIYNQYFTNRNSFTKLPQKSKRILILIGFSELISVSSFFLSIKLTDNPAIVSFLANTSPIFVILIGFLFLKTRYSIFSILGILITLSGVLVMNSKDTSFEWSLFISPASISALIFALFYGISLVLARSEIKTISTSLVTICRSLFLFAGFLLYNLFLMKMPTYSAQSVFYIAIGATLGPFLGILLTLTSLKFVDASVTTLIGTLRSIFIVIGALLFMGIFPGANQLLGGGLTIFGILIITTADIRSEKKSKC